MRDFVDRLHQLNDWENELSYHDGYVAGYAAAVAQLEVALRFALGGEDARSMREAARRLHHTIASRKRRELEDEPGPRPGDYPGGPVPF